MLSLMKILIVVALALAATSISDSSPVSEINSNYLLSRPKNGSHHLVVGNRQYGDFIVYRENISESYQISGMKLILNRTIEVPYGSVITQVRCLDQITDGTGAEVIVTGGGPDLGWVELRFKSQRWRGIYFLVEVYARKR